MPSLKWTPNALHCVRELYDFLTEKDQAAARLAISAIRKKVALLAVNPNIGRPAVDLDPEHRELLVPFGATGYVVLYHTTSDLILVLAVRHQKEVGY